MSGKDDGVDADTRERAARHILNDLGFVARRAGDEVHGSAEVVPEMCVPGTGHLRTSILATWVDHVSGLAALVPFAPRVPVTLELDVHVYGNAPGGGTVHAAARVLKAGRSVVVCGVDVVDGDVVVHGDAHGEVPPAEERGVLRERGGVGLEDGAGALAEEVNRAVGRQPVIRWFGVGSPGYIGSGRLGSHRTRKDPRASHPFGGRTPRRACRPNSHTHRLDRAAA